MTVITKSWRSTLGALCIGSIISFSAFPTNAAADDTEVFFGQLDPSLEIFPNVLFVLDTSGSMNWTDSAEGQDTTRITRLKKAMIEILDSANNVNIGLMRFNGSNGGGPVLYPITYIDEPVCDSENCGTVNLVERISDGINDAQEREDGSIAIVDTAIQMSQGDATTSVAGFRFPNLNIPSGVTITSATLELTSLYDNSTANELVISAEYSGDSEKFAALAKNLSSRPKTTSKKSWVNNDWYRYRKHQSPDISNIVQEVIDHTAWCGGNALSLFVGGTGSDGGERDAIAFELSPNDAAVLKVTYDSTALSDDEGCMSTTSTFQVAYDSDDAEENMKTNKVDRNSVVLDLGREDKGDGVLTGVRFRNVAIPDNAVISDAHLEFTVRNHKSGSVTMTIWGEDKSNPKSFKKKKSDISSRTKTTASTTWTDIAEAHPGDKIQTTPVTNIVREVIDRSDWESGSEMAFLFEYTSGTSRREFESYKGKAVEAPRLRVTYQRNVGGNSGSIITAREKMKTLVNNLVATGGTPIVDAQYEATLYYRGLPVDYGLQRGPDRSRYHRVSSPLSYTGGTVSRDSQCTDADLDSSYCRDEKILNSAASGTATYISPIESSCQTNQIVLLSDGEPTSNSSAEKALTLMTDHPNPENPIESCRGSDLDKMCGPELAYWLANSDHSPENGKQSITTYTIGMNLNSAFLDELAKAGGSGTSFRASSSAELVNIFSSILSEVLSVDTSFVAPGATVNQFNRLTHRNDIYFSLFKPQERPIWHGNLKKYSLHLAPDGNVRVYDNSSPAKLAVDQQSGFFAEGTKSYWSERPDGNVVALGGAANELALPRRVYTYTGNDTKNITLNTPSNYFHESNVDTITRDLLGIGGQTQEYQEKLIKWARGVDVNDDNGDGDYTDIRKHLGDPMHSRPLLVNYATSTSTPDSTIYISTNEGFLHALRHTDGSEVFSFIPKELLSNLDIYYRNSSSDNHPYGLDGTLTSWVDDINDNTVADPGENVTLYMGMRRGGRNYYALDVTSRDNPKLKWVIKGGTIGFEQLAQTWSKMIKSKVKINGTERDVLFFAGGYDTNQDPADDGSVDTRSADSIGRAIFMVDASTGEKLWTGSGFTTNYGGGEHTFFPDMKYSIPSDLRVVDINFDGIADQFYVGDMGGQVWRFDVNQEDNGEDLIKGGVLAEFAQDGDPTKARRFFYEPDVALLSDQGSRYLAISIGSGWRSHPLDELVEDEFFMIRTNSVYNAPEGYGKVDDPTAIPHTYSRITESDLLDITDDMDREIDWTSNVGWRLRMQEKGEKVLSDSITVNNQIVFTTYVPQKASVACTTAVGGGRVYVLDLRDGKPKLNLDGRGDESSLTESDRGKDLVHGGIPPEPAALFTEEGNPIILVGPEQPLNDISLSNEAVRTYWRESNQPTETASSEQQP